MLTYVSILTRVSPLFSNFSSTSGFQSEFFLQAALSNLQLPIHCQIQWDGPILLNFLALLISLVTTFPLIFLLSGLPYH